MEGFGYKHALAASNQVLSLCLAAHPVVKMASRIWISSLCFAALLLASILVLLLHFPPAEWVS